MAEIHIQLPPGTGEQLIKRIAERYGVYAKYKGEGYWKFSSEDPENFLWFGIHLPLQIQVDAKYYYHLNKE